MRSHYARPHLWMEMRGSAGKMDPGQPTRLTVFIKSLAEHSMWWLGDQRLPGYAFEFTFPQEAGGDSSSIFSLFSHEKARGLSSSILLLTGSVSQGMFFSKSGSALVSNIFCCSFLSSLHLIQEGKKQNE